MCQWVNCTAQEHRQNRRTQIYIPEYGKAWMWFRLKANMPEEIQFSLLSLKKFYIVNLLMKVPQDSDPSIVHSTSGCYLILRSFQTKAYAEKYLREIMSEIPGVQVVGESTPRIGIKQISYQEAKETKRNSLKIFGYWILLQ